MDTQSALKMITKTKYAAYMTSGCVACTPQANAFVALLYAGLKQVIAHSYGQLTDTMMSSIVVVLCESCALSSSYPVRRMLFYVNRI